MSDELLPLAESLRLEAACNRFEAAWRAGPPPRVEDYLAGWEGPGRAALLRELVLLDAHYRRSRGPWPGEAATTEAVGPAATAAPAGLPAVPGYEVVGELGRGGMGEVVRGRDLHLGRDLAVKVLLAKYRDHPLLVRRFLGEARIHARLQHPGIVPVHELGELPDRRPYFTMKLVEGRTLASLLRARADPGQDRPRFLAIFEQVCQTLAFAHSRGIIHRDLKPANVMVGAFGEVQVMDWGLAKALDRGRGAPAAAPGGAPAVNGPPAGDDDPGLVTQSGIVLGTLPYAAPEQARGEGEQLDERCDVFGLGAILCEVLTGRPPFAGADRDELLARAQAGDHAAAIAALTVSGADAELVRLAKACLAAEPSARLADAGAVAAALTAYLAGVQERLRRSELQRAAAEARAVEERKRRRAQLALAAAVLLLAAGGGGGAWWAQQQRQAHDAEVVRQRLERAAEQAQQRLQADAAVAPHLRDARRLLAEAKRATTLADLAKSAEALAAAQKADELARTGGASEEMRRQAAALVAELAAETEAGRRDRVLLAALLAVRTPREGPKYQKDDKGLMVELAEPSADEQFVAAFRQWDSSFDADGLATAAAAARLRGRPAVVLTEVIAALDHWADERRRDAAQGWKDPAGWRRLARLAAALDDSAPELRDLLMGGDLERDLGLAALGVALRPVPVPFDALPREGRDRLRRLAEQVDVTREPVLGLLTLVRAQSLAGDGARAEGLLKRALCARPQEVVLYDALGQLLESQRPPRWAEAVECYAAARALRPELGERLAEALRMSGRAEDGLALYERLAAERPDNPWLHYQRGIALQERGRFSQAEAAFRAALHFRPNHPETHYNLSRALVGQDRFPEAEAALRAALGLRPHFPEAYNNLGCVLARQGRYGEAQAAYRAALGLNSDLLEAHHNLGVVLCEHQGRYPEAEAEFRAVIRLEPDSPSAHYNLGVSLSRQERCREAEAEFRKAISLKPDDPPANENLGVALAKQGRLKEAEVAVRKAISLKSDHALAHYTLGHALDNQGRHKEAEASYREALRLQPDFPEAHCNLGHALCDQGRFAEALEEQRRGHELGSKVPGWPYPSADWVRQCERLMELDRKRAAVLRGEAEPLSAAACLELAYLCQQYRKLPCAATRLYADAFTADPTLTDALGAQHRYNAACSAALAAAGQGEDAKGLPDKVRRMLRRQALGWLRADLALSAQLAERGDAAAKQTLGQRLGHWQQDSDLASVRDRQALAQMPDDERRQWHTLWDEVAVLLEKAEGGK